MMREWPEARTSAMVCVGRIKNKVSIMGKKRTEEPEAAVL